MRKVGHVSLCFLTGISFFFSVNASSDTAGHTIPYSTTYSQVNANKNSDVSAANAHGKSAIKHNSGYKKVFSDLALQCIHQEYPNIIKHTMSSDADAKTPKALYPAFYGCLDWHSSVHGHWLLVRLLNTGGDDIAIDTIIASLNKSFSQRNIEGEIATIQRPNNKAFERPYGLAWFLQLTGELRQSSLPEAAIWMSRLKPLEDIIVERIESWLPKLAYPIRTGEHSQTAFAFGLMLDWSRIANNESFEVLLMSRIKDYYEDDTQCPIHYEPSGQDFLSPCLAEADLMRRVLSEKEYGKWLTDFFPTLTSTSINWLEPATVTDKTDGKLAHLDGLNISRAWMIEGIIHALDTNDPRISALQKVMKAHRDAGLNAVLEDMHYMGSHWLGSFASYLETSRGIE
ncbi:DUF2891 domain-containing protein [Alteromonas sp. A081]|uniref:DUF2891 domain-containing protein n=1 Tax=Alteromonas sp. A081 TaxID=3410269 RepID=UPI003B9809AC